MIDFPGLPADAEGGITFATVGLRFVAVNRTCIEAYDSNTGQRLLTSEELKAQAAPEATARTLAEARAVAEAERADALAEGIRALKSQYGLQ